MLQREGTPSKIVFLHMLSRCLRPLGVQVACCERAQSVGRVGVDAFPRPGEAERFSFLAKTGSDILELSALPPPRPLVMTPVHGDSGH